MLSLRARLVLSHLLPFVIILPLVGVLILYLFMAQVIITDLSDDLEERAALIGNALAQQPEILSDVRQAEAFIAEISVLVDGEIYLLNAEGELLAANALLDEMPEAGAIATRVEEGSFNRTEVTVAGTFGAQEGEALAPIIDVNQQLVGIVGVRETLSDVASGFAQLRRLVIFIALGGMALGALLGYMLAMRLEKPIVRSAVAVTAIAEGNSTEPLPLTGPREVRELSASVNLLAERLRLLEQTRQRSLANIVHELGRPLGAVLAAVHVLRQTPGDDPEVRMELLTGIETELTQMEPLLDDLAMLHDDVTGQQRLELEPVETSKWLAATLLPWRAAALEKGLAWQATVDPHLPPLTIDPERMAQVVGNLLSNAIKYTPAGGAITVSTEQTANRVLIHVYDTGPGINPAEQERVFEPFYRSRTPQRFSEGLGLGLSIARSLTEAHGGTLTLDSSPGTGSTFTITLPR